MTKVRTLLKEYFDLVKVPSHLRFAKRVPRPVRRELSRASGMGSHSFWGKWHKKAALLLLEAEIQRVKERKGKR